MKAYNLDTAVRHLEAVTALYLQRCGLSEIPSPVFDCPRLRRLEFSYNGLAAAPSGLARLTGLEYLNLAGNRLRTLPAELAALTELRTLDLSGNDLETVPEWVWRLPRLEALLLSGNQLRQLPSAIGDVRSLRRLHLADNQLTRLPAAIGRLVDLRELLLNGNRLSTLPSGLKSQSALERLELADNRLKVLPEDLLPGWPHLAILRLAGNRLSALPESMASCRLLIRLDASRNRLETLPNGVGRLPWLIKLDLRKNRLRQLPATIGNAPMLQEVDLSRNQLRELAALPPRLRSLNLAHNEFSKFPEALLQLPALERLDLSYNDLAEWPADLSGWPALRQLALSGNDLQGFPGPLLQLSHLEKLKGAGPPPARKQLLQLLRAGRSSPVAEPLPAVFFDLLQGRERLSELSLLELGQGLCFSMKAVRIVVRQHLVQERGAGLRRYPLREGALLGLVGKTHFDEELLQGQLANSGISLLPRAEYRAATHLVLGDRPRAAPDLRPEQVFLSEPDLNAFLDRSGDRYLVRKSSSEQLDRLRSLLLHRETHNVRLAAQLLRGGGVPRELLTDLFAAWKQAPRGRLKRDLRQLLELNLPESDRWVLSLRSGLSGRLSAEQRKANIRRFTETTVLDGDRLRSILAALDKEEQSG